MRKKNFTRNKIIRVLIAMFVVALVVSAFMIGIRPSLKSDELNYIKLPEGFKITIFASGLGGSPVSTPGPNPGPRMMLLKDGILFVTIPSQGKVVALPDKNKDSKADDAITFIGNLGNPHGIDFHDGWFYIAEEERVVRVRDADNDLHADQEIEVLTEGLGRERLPHGGHFTRTIKIHNGSLYISAGSSCNVCYEENERRAAITRCNLDGTNCSIFARGLRNAVGFVFHEGRMYATENGRDWLGDNAPPDEINLVEEGKNYGWPVCYGKNIHDTDFDKNVHIRDPCEDAAPSLVDLQAHSAPLGLAFYTGDNFPEEYRGDLFVAYHGSWNRGEPTGYKIVSIDMNNPQVKDFATGWLQGNNISGRPVDIIVAADGSLFVSDDNAGKIYRIYYEG